MTLAVVALAALAAAPPAGATLPGPNGLLAFAGERSGVSQIYTLDIRRDRLRRVTHVAGSAIAPHWSPDGRRLVFEFDHLDDGSCQIAIINADGSGMRTLTPHDPNHCDENPTFTPDGTRILFDRAIGIASCTDTGCEITDQAIWSMSAGGGNARRITSGPGFAYAPEVSPDGRMLAFVGAPNDTTANALYVSRIDGSQRHRITPYFEVQYKHEWAPDGREIVFLARVRGSSDAINVVTIAPDGTGLELVTTYRPPHRAGGVSYSPDGRWIAYRGEESGQFALLATTRDQSVLRMLLPFSWSFKPHYITWGPRPR